MDTFRLTDVRLTHFKSYKDEVLELSPLTLVVGPNASGKSNALDALAMLSLLADERNVADLERGDQEVAGLRGGLSGSAPFGSDEVTIGCSVGNGDTNYDLDVTFDVSGDPEIREETLVMRRGQRNRTLISATTRGVGTGIGDAATYSGGAPRSYPMLTSRLFTVQALTKIPQDTRARESVVAACEAVVGVLRGILVLDPIPGQMRGYPRIGSAPDRWGTSTSAIVYSLREDRVAWERLNRLVRGLVGPRFDTLTFAEAKLPQGRAIDVMLAIRETISNSPHVAPASTMSDGTLRFVAIVSTLLSMGRSRDEPSLTTANETVAARTLVVEEVENGLYPTQAAVVLDLLREEAALNRVTLLATTHSPALLDAMTPEDHDGVLVCGRRHDDSSSLLPLVDHPNYLRIAGSGTVGTAVSRGALEESPAPSLRFADLLDRR